jgi:hypothetical protein
MELCRFYLADALFINSNDKRLYTRIDNVREKVKKYVI